MVYSPSVDVRPDWTMVEQIAFPSFAKLHFPVPTPEDLEFCGQLQYYDKVRSPVVLQWPTSFCTGTLSLCIKG